jgi:uncharacterized membrane protein YhaH (DUF805 family)
MNAFADSVKQALSRYADFAGSSSRSEYWHFFLFNFLVHLFSFLIDSYLLPHNISYLGIVALLVLFLPFTAVSVRRLHEIGLSGWWYLLVLVPFGGLVLLYWFVQPSKEQDNPYRLAAA